MYSLHEWMQDFTGVMNMKTIKFAPFDRTQPRGYVTPVRRSGFKYQVIDDTGLVCEGFADTEQGAESLALDMTRRIYDQTAKFYAPI